MKRAPATLLLTILLITSSISAMEQRAAPAARSQDNLSTAHDSILIAKLLKAVNAKDFNAYFELRNKELQEKQTQLCNATLEETHGKKHCILRHSKTIRTAT